MATKRFSLISLLFATLLGGALFIGCGDDNGTDTPEVSCPVDEGESFKWYLPEEGTTLKRGETVTLRAGTSLTAGIGFLHSTSENLRVFTDTEINPSSITDLPGGCAEFSFTLPETVPSQVSFIVRKYGDPNESLQSATFSVE